MLAKAPEADLDDFSPVVLALVALSAIIDFIGCTLRIALVVLTALLT